MPPPSSLRPVSACFREVRLRARHAGSVEEDFPLLPLSQPLAGDPIRSDVFLRDASRGRPCPKPPPAQEAFRIPDKFVSCAPDGTAKAEFARRVPRWLEKRAGLQRLREHSSTHWTRARECVASSAPAVAQREVVREPRRTLGTTGGRRRARAAMMLPICPRQEPEERCGDPGVACADVDARRSGGIRRSWPRPLIAASPHPSQDPNRGSAPREEGGSAAASGTYRRRKLLQCLVSGAETTASLPRRRRR